MTDGSDAPAGENEPADHEESPAGFRAGDLLDSKVWIPLLLICVAGWILRTTDFNVSWLNPDEGTYYSMVTWDEWGQFWEECTSNAHPPLFYLLLRLTSWISSDFSTLRMVSLISGCLWAPALFLFVRHCSGRGVRGGVAGLAAAFLVSFSPCAIMFGGLLRPYAFLVLVLTVGLYCLARYLDRGTARSLSGYTFWMFLALMTHYSAILLLGAVAIVLVIMLVTKQLTREQSRRLMLFNTPLLLTIGLLYLLHMRQLATSAVTAEALTGWLKPFMFGGAAEGFWRVSYLLGGMFNGQHSWFPGAGIDDAQGPAFLLFLIGIGLAFWQKRYLIALLPLAAWLIAALLSYLAKYPFGASRHSLYLTAPMLLPIAYAIGWGCRPANRRWVNLTSAAVTLIVLVGLFLCRGIVSELVRSSSNQFTMLGETPVSQQTITEARERVITPVKNSPGIVLMSQQGHNLLMPLFYRERQDAVNIVDEKTLGPIKQFRWGRRKVIVWNGEWEFSVKWADFDKRKHLRICIDAVDASLPDARLGECSDAVLFFGGWSQAFAALKQYGDYDRNGLPRKRSFVASRFNLPGFQAIVFDLARFQREMHALDKAHPNR